MRVLLTLPLLLTLVSLIAQPANDDCTGAIEITDVQNFCSAPAAYTNDAATPGSYTAPTCFSNNSHDVWFKFTAQATDVTINVIGAIGGASNGGTLLRPEVALYQFAGAPCTGTVNELQCESDNLGNNIIELYKGALTPGVEYYIRVEGRNDNTGTFQLCVNNYNPPVDPSSDCPTASILCDKSPFVVQSVVGVGNDPNEVPQSACLGPESNSTWFVWTAANNGALTFTLTPSNPNDDIDFILYELPNGIGDCSGKIQLRCMATACLGPTGLDATSTQTTETPGCTPGDDGFLQALQMQQGTSYALMVNNFTSSGNGFSMEFDGNGEFVGPEPAFTTNQVGNSACFGQTFIFEDASTFALGSIAAQQWSFGPGAAPATATGPGPHSVTYDSPGERLITLTVTSDEGCIVTDVSAINVDPCCGTVATFDVQADLTAVDCPEDGTGAIALTIDAPYPPYSVVWSTGDITETISNLTLGTYEVQIVDEYCDTLIAYDLPGPPPFTFDTISTLATCAGGTDGALQLVVGGGTPPYQFNWEGTGFTSDNTYSNLPIGDYTVVVRDANDCTSQQVLTVRELELVLDPDVAAVTPPSCFGFSDGSIVVDIDNGQPPFQYDFNDGQGFQSDNALLNIAEGVYTVDVVDANSCTGQFVFDIQSPELLVVEGTPDSVSCFGLSDGSILTTTTGGTEPYTYQWSDGNTEPDLLDVPAGSYTVTVTDANSCSATATIDVEQPAELLIDAIDVNDILCFGDSTGTANIVASGGNPPYEYSADGIVYRSTALLTDLPGGTNTYYVRDQLGCVATLDATIVQPEELVAIASGDTTVALGYPAPISTVVLPFGRPVTYAWSPVEGLDCIDCPAPVAVPFATTTYTVLITDEDGCTGLDSVTIVVDPLRPIYIPTAFSPNEDGLNDGFTAYGGPAASLIVDLKVFDRWGGLLYEGADLPLGDESSGWDGRARDRDVQSGVYTYMMVIRFIDGVEVLYSGDVTILP